MAKPLLRLDLLLGVAHALLAREWLAQEPVSSELQLEKDGEAVLFEQDWQQQCWIKLNEAVFKLHLAKALDGGLRIEQCDWVD